MNYKLSFYSIVTEPVNEAGKRLLHSTRTSKTLAISPLCWEFLQAGRIQEIPQVMLNKLIQIQAVVPDTEDELQLIVNENNQYIDENKSGLLYEVIQPSAMCQLGCYYCGQDHVKKNIDKEMYDKIEQRIRDKASTGEYKHLYIGWFGAEPLMGLQQMRALTKRFKQIAKDFNLSYGAKIVTNGLSLKEKIYEELATEMSVKKIEVTLDGTAEYHDKHRYTKKGGESFDLIFKNLKQILNKPNFRDFNCDISIRCNVDEKNVDGVDPLIDLLVKHELHTKIAYFYPIGVYSWGNDAHKKSLTKEEFAKKELKWRVKMMKHSFNGSNGIGNTSRKKSVCMATSKSSELIDAYGNIFNCTEVSYVSVYENTDYVLGNVKNAPLVEKEKRAFHDWYDRIGNGEFPCHSCKMLPVCGGGCPKQWVEGNLPCPNNKFNIKEKLQLKYILSDSEQKEEAITRMENYLETIT